MKKSVLTIDHLRVAVDAKEIIGDVSLHLTSGEVHAIMGPNGSGKSTLAYALMGHPNYKVQSRKSAIKINGKNLLGLPAAKRAKAGLFLAFQSPIAIPGVSVVNLLRTSYQELHADTSRVKGESVQNPLLAKRWKGGGMGIGEFTNSLHAHAKSLHIDETFLSRGIHDGFSGGEKKKIEMLQALTLAPKFAVFDEIDTGLDVDALKVVAKGIELLSRAGTGVLIITHYQRILKYVKPDVVHVLVKGKIVKSGGAPLAKKIEEDGYSNFFEN